MVLARDRHGLERGGLGLVELALLEVGGAQLVQAPNVLQLYIRQLKSQTMATFAKPV